MIAKIRNLISSLVKKWAPVFIATFTGLLVLVGYLFPTPLLVGYRGRPTELRDVLIEWAVIVAAFAFVLGAVNILRVHGARAFRRQRGWPYSLVLLIAMLIGAIPPLLEILQWFLGDIPLQESIDHLIFDHVISPLGASLAALVAFTLTLAAFRLLRARRGLPQVLLGWLFILIVAVVLIGSAPPTGLIANLGFLAEVREWIISVPGMAGMRGLLLGVVLGTVITALRVLVVSDRPHSEF